MLRLAALILTLLPATLAAQTTAGFRALLADLPALPAEVAYGDLAAARALDVSAVAGANRDPVILQLRALPRVPLTDGVRDPRTAWRAVTGFGPPEVLRMATWIANPEHAAVFDLAPGAGAAVPGALAASGYAEETRNGVTAWAARGADFDMSLRARNPDDPFGGTLGMSARVQVDGDRLRQARSWPMLAAMGTAPALAADRQVTALLDALERITGAGALIGATLWMDTAEMGLIDGAGMILLADLSDGPNSTGVLALTIALPDAAAAQRLTERVATDWSQRPTTAGVGATFGGMTGGPAQVTVDPLGDGLWVLTLTQARPTETYTRSGTLTRNVTYTWLSQGLMQRDLVFVQP